MKMNGPNDYHAYGDENGYSTSYKENKLLSFFQKKSSNQSAISAVNKIAVEKDEIIESKITSNS